MDKKILATVNGVEITEMDMQETIARFPRERQGVFNGEEGRKQLLDQMISFELIYNYAKDNGMDKDEAYQHQAEKVLKEILTQFAINNVLSKVEVSDKEAEDYYDANKEMFKNGASVTASHILVSTEDEAKKVAEEIQKGLSFEEAAMKYSSCPSKEAGGNLGTFTKGQMVPEFENAAFDAELNVVTEPVKTQFGYHLIKVMDKAEASSKSYDEVKGMIKGKLLQERQNYKYMQLTEELKGKYNVEIK